MLHDVIDRQAALKDRLEHILEGKDPDRPSEEINASVDALQEASDAELERLITDPALEKAENAAIREQVMALLSERKGADFVDELLQQAEVDQSSWLQMMSGGEGEVEGETPAKRARETFAKYMNPLAEIIPDDLSSFIIDPQGNFYMRMETPELVHLRDFDLLIGEEISGTLEPDRIRDVFGLTAMSQMDQELVQFQLLEFFVQGRDITIMTDHPLARVVHLLYDDFLVVV